MPARAGPIPYEFRPLSHGAPGVSGAAETPVGFGAFPARELGSQGPSLRSSLVSCLVKVWEPPVEGRCADPSPALSLLVGIVSPTGT